MTVDERLLELDKDVNVREATSFGGPLPLPFIPNTGLEVGDTLKFRKPYKIRERKLSGKWHSFAVLERIKADGTKTTFDFFPPKYARPLYEYEIVNGKAKFVAMRPHKGTFITKVMEYVGKDEKDENDVITKTSTDKLMDYLGDNNIDIEVKNIALVNTRAFVDGKPSDTELTEDKNYTIDIK